MPSAYQDCLTFLYGRLNYERQAMPRTPGEFRLSRMLRLLARLGDPQDALEVVHVAGTKGKGSTSAMIAAALTASGHRVGLFCSPHLHRLEERFRVDGVEAAEHDLVRLTEQVRPVVEAIDLAGSGRGPTFFEITTAMGLLHFASVGADLVVLEVGLGGRLDSTNVVRPVVSVITNISFDHTRQLGQTLAAISTEKAGIIKRGVPVVSGETRDEARAPILRNAAQRRCTLRELGADFAYSYSPAEPPLSAPRAGRFSMRTWRTEWGTLPLPLLGPHQAHNAAVALATLDVLAERGFAVERSGVESAFSSLSFPARVEVVSEAPWIVIDGAHNVASAEALAETLRLCFPPAERTLIFGTTREKDLKGQLRALLPGTTRVIATRYVQNPRSVPPEEVAEAVAALEGPPVFVTHHPAEALAAARARTPEDGLICVTGSLFLAAETRDEILMTAPA
jgi:dihydrofolate synthase / folylpolyglutamate synthase